MKIPRFPIPDDLANDCIMFFAVLFFLMTAVFLNAQMSLLVSRCLMIYRLQLRITFKFGVGNISVIFII